MIKVPAMKASPAPWDDIPWEQWEDWRWQLANRLTAYIPLFSKALKQETDLRRWFRDGRPEHVAVPAGFAERLARRAFQGDPGIDFSIGIVIYHTTGRAH